MPNYSHSKLSCFEECKHKYKLKYIEFKKVEAKTPAFFVVGSTVHKALELLYKEVAKERVVSKEELNQLYINKTILGSFSNNAYWTSSEYNSHSVWAWDFNGGYQGSGYNSKDTMFRIRAIRAF